MAQSKEDRQRAKMALIRQRIARRRRLLTDADGAQQPIFSNVVAMMPDDGVSTSAATGRSSYGLTWTCVGGAAWDAANVVHAGTSIATGTRSQNRYVRYPDNANQELGSGDWCVEGWMYHTTLPSASTNGGHALIGKVGSTGDNRSFFFRFTTTDELQVAVYHDGTSPNVTTLTTSGITVAINTWYHVAVNRNGSTMKIWLDGVEVASTTITAGSYDESTSTWRIGSINFVSTAASYHAGYIQDVRITVGEPVYTAPFTPPGILPEE